MRALGAKIGSRDFLLHRQLHRPSLKRRGLLLWQWPWRCMGDAAVTLKTCLPRKSCAWFPPSASSSTEAWDSLAGSCIRGFWCCEGEARQGESPDRERVNPLPHRQLWMQVRELLALWGRQNGRGSALWVTKGSVNCKDYSRAQPAISGVRKWHSGIRKPTETWKAFSPCSPKVEKSHRSAIALRRWVYYSFERARRDGQKDFNSGVNNVVWGLWTTQSNLNFSNHKKKIVLTICNLSGEQLGKYHTEEKMNELCGDGSHHSGKVENRTPWQFFRKVWAWRAEGWMKVELSLQDCFWLLLNRKHPCTSLELCL